MEVSDIHIPRVCLCFQRRLGDGQLLRFAQSIAFDRKLDQELSGDGMMNDGLVTHNSFWVSVVLMASLPSMAAARVIAVPILCSAD